MSGIFHWNEGVIHEGGVFGKKDASVSGTVTWRINHLEDLTALNNNKLDSVTSNQTTQISRLVEIRDYLDNVETHLSQIISDSSTHETNRNSDADIANTRLTEIRDYIDTVETNLSQIITDLGTYETNRNSDQDLANTRLTEVRDYLDTVETKLAQLLTDLSTYEVNRNTDQDLANTRLTEIRDYVDAVETSLSQIISDLATYEGNRNTDQDLTNTRLGNADQSGLGVGSTGVMGFLKELWSVGYAGSTNTGIKIILNGTPITGASMPSGGFGATGWLSAIWKNQDVNTVDSTNYLLKSLKNTSQPKGSGIIHLTTNNISFSAGQAYNWVTIYSYNIPNGQFFVPTYHSMMGSAAGYTTRIVERTELGTLTANGGTGVFVDGLAANESGEFWTEVHLDVSLAFANGSDPFTVTVSYNNQDNVSKTTTVSVRRNQAYRFLVPLASGDVGFRDITNLQITAGGTGQTAGFLTCVGLKEVSILTSRINDAYEMNRPDRTSLKGNRKMCIEATAGGGATQTIRGTVTGYLTSEA